jgi:hypothetical protein
MATYGHAQSTQVLEKDKQLNRLARYSGLISVGNHTISTALNLQD